MKRSILRAVALLATLAAAHAAHSQQPNCKDAEEGIAEISVQIVKAYNSMDFEKAREIEKVISSQIDKGSSAAKTCGCPSAMGPLAKIRGLTSKAFETNDFSEVQAGLADTITVAEQARNEAEQCWRKAVASAAGTKAGK